jgi:hypothetical protein
MNSMHDFPRWGMVWGRWWSVVYSADRTISLGFHIEPLRRERGTEPFHYGPYVDFHLPTLCLSFGNNPIYVSSLQAQRAYARGGLT